MANPRPAPVAGRGVWHETHDTRMKLSEYFTVTSSLDDFTLRHLREWAEYHRPSSEDANTVCAWMVAYLESLDATDREYAINRGWTHVFDSASRALAANHGL